MKTFAIIVLVATACSIAAAQPAEDIALSKIVDVSAPVHCVGPVKVYRTCKFEGVAKNFEKEDGMTVIRMPARLQLQPQQDRPLRSLTSKLRWPSRQRKYKNTLKVYRS